MGRNNKQQSINLDQYYNSKHFKKLLSLYEQNSKQGKGFYMDLDDLTDIAEYYSNIGKVDKALLAAQTALELFPDANPPRILISRYELAEHKDAAKAKQIADSCIDKEDEEYVLLQAEIMLFENKVDEADQYLQKEIGSMEWEEYDQVCLDIVGLYVDYNLFDKASAWLDKVNDVSDPYYKEMKANVLMASGDYKQSEKLWEEVLNADPFAVDNWNSLAQSQFMLDDFSGSMTSSDYALAIEPNNVDALINKANSLFAIGNYEEAYKYYSQYSELEPKNPLGRLFTGLSLINLEHNEEGLEQLTKAMDLSDIHDKHVPELYQEIAITLCALKRTDDAHKYLDKAREAGVDAPEIYIARGYVLLTEGKTVDAWEVFNKLLKKTNYSIRVFKQIATTYVDCGFMSLGATLIESVLENGDSPWYEGNAYLARCAYFLHEPELMIDNLTKVCREDPGLAANILSDIFPPNTPPEDYPEVAKEMLYNKYNKRK